MTEGQACRTHEHYAEGILQVPAQALFHFTGSSRELISVSMPEVSQISNQNSPLSPRSSWLLVLMSHTKFSLSRLGLCISSQTCSPPTLRPVLSERCPTIPICPKWRPAFNFSLLLPSYHFLCPRHLVRNPFCWMSCLPFIGCLLPHIPRWLPQV